MISPHMVSQPIYIIYGSFMHHGSGRRLLGVALWYHDIPECLRSISYLVNIILASILASGVEESIVNSDICEFWMMASYVLHMFVTTVLGPSNPVEFHHLVNCLCAPSSSMMPNSGAVSTSHRPSTTSPCPRRRVKQSSSTCSKIIRDSITVLNYLL